MPGEHHILKDLPFYEVARMVDAKAHQDRLVQRKKKRQKVMLRQALGRNRTATSSTIRPPIKKKKHAAQDAKKALDPTPASPSTSTSAPSSAASAEQDLKADLHSTRANSETKVESIVPYIICEAEKKEEDMATNL